MLSRSGPTTECGGSRVVLVLSLVIQCGVVVVLVDVVVVVGVVRMIIHTSAYMCMYI